MSKPIKHPFVDYLVSLTEGQERGALAALRRGLGQAPGTFPEMYRYVEPWLPKKRYPDQEAAYYLVAALFGLHPVYVSSGNMGGHLAQCLLVEPKLKAALERRFTSLLSSHPDDLPVPLRQAVNYLKSKDVSVNWNQLLTDLQNWGHPDRFVQKRWASEFWGARRIEDQAT